MYGADVSSEVVALLALRQALGMGRKVCGHLRSLTTDLSNCLATMNVDERIVRFRNQYFQTQDVNSLSWPPDELLRSNNFQEALWKTVFGPDAFKYFPPDRYQSRVLKELMKRTEASIQDSEEDVGRAISI